MKQIKKKNRKLSKPNRTFKKYSKMASSPHSGKDSQRETHDAEAVNNFKKLKKPCRACVDFKTWTKKQTTGSGTGSGSATAGPMMMSAEIDNNNQEKVAFKDHECPVDVEQLGSHSWSLLHTMAANYPDEPSQEDQTRMKTFISSLSYLYPCEMCAHDFQKRIKKEPVQTDTRHNLAQWMCRIHNQINRMLGKNSFDCSKVDERWRDGWKDGSCD